MVDRASARLPLGAPVRVVRPPGTGLGFAAACSFGLLGCGYDEATLITAPPPAHVCIGTEPPTGAWSDEPACACGDAGAPDGGPSDVRPVVGSSLPSWALLDFQPQSCGFGATYGLDAYAGEVVLLAVLESS